MRSTAVRKHLAHVYPPTSDDLVEKLKADGIKNPQILFAFTRVERDLFTPQEKIELAYTDQAIPLKSGRVMQSPSLIAKILEALHLKGHEKILEIGTGSGYLTALLSVLAKEVYSIENSPNLADEASANLRFAGIHDTFVFATDGKSGLPLYAPFNIIISNFSVRELPPAWIDQLEPEGRLIAPLRQGDSEPLLLFQKIKGRMVPRKSLGEGLFPYFHKLNLA